jgi:signal transduction histidine kinase
MKAGRSLAEAALSAVPGLAAVAVFGLSVYLSGSGGGGLGPGDWLYALSLALICIAAGSLAAAFRRSRQIRLAREEAERGAEAARRLEREAFRLERQNLSDSHMAWVHELKTPLTAMRLVLDSPRARQGSEALARDIRAEAARLESLLELSLYESRAESFDRDYVICEVNVRKAATEAAAQLAGGFNAAGVGLAMAEFELVALSDAKWLSFVVRQVLLNALKHSPEGSKVRIGARKGRRGDELCIEDSGPGIPPEDLERVFDRGFTGSGGARLAGGRKALPEPTGMGLYLCGKLCAKLGHGIWAENVPDSGCRFVISFPPDSGHLVKA